MCFSDSAIFQRILENSSHLQSVGERKQYVFKFGSLKVKLEEIRKVLPFYCDVCKVLLYLTS